MLAPAECAIAWFGIAYAIPPLPLTAISLSFLHGQILEDAVLQLSAEQQAQASIGSHACSALVRSAAMGACVVDDPVALGRVMQRRREGAIFLAADVDGVHAVRLMAGLRQDSLFLGFVPQILILGIYADLCGHMLSAKIARAKCLYLLYIIKKIPPLSIYMRFLPYSLFPPSYCPPVCFRVSA